MNEILLMTRQEFDDLVTRLDQLIDLTSNAPKSGTNRVITNNQLLKEFEISKKTAQNWRTDGLITFMQVGRKIYYNIDDVHKTLKNHSREAFKSKLKYRDK